jgi:hypothetical protein
VRRGSTYIGHGTHPDVSLIGKRLDLGEYLSPHGMSMIADQDQFEGTWPLFRQQTNEPRPLANETTQRLQFVEFAEGGVIVFFLQIDTLGPKNVKRDKHLQNRLFEVPCAFGAN